MIYVEAGVHNILGEPTENICVEQDDKSAAMAFNVIMKCHCHILSTCIMNSWWIIIPQSNFGCRETILQQWRRKLTKPGGANLLNRKYFYGQKLKFYEALLKSGL